MRSSPRRRQLLAAAVMLVTTVGLLGSAPASAAVSVSADVPAGTYAVTMVAADADGATASCLLNVQVTRILTVGEVQGTTLDSEDGKADRSPLAPSSGNGSSSQLYDVQGVITQRTLGRTASGAPQYGFFLQSRYAFRVFRDPHPLDDKATRCSTAATQSGSSSAASA